MATTMNINSNSRRILDPPVQSRRIRHENLDKSIPIDHDQDERLPLEAHLSYGVGAKDDRLTLINLSTGKMTQLPSRASILRALPDAKNHAWLRYSGESGFTKMTAGKLTGQTQLSAAATLDSARAASGTDPFALFGRWGATAGSNKASVVPCGWNSANSHDFAQAFVTNGMATHQAGNLSKTTGIKLINFIHPHTIDDGADGSIILQLDKLLDGITTDDLIEVDGSGEPTADAKALFRTLAYLYSSIPTTRSDVIGGWSETLMKLPSELQYVENALYNLYGRNRSTKFARAIGSSGAVPFMLSLIEAGRSIRRGRPVENIASYDAITDFQIPHVEDTNVAGSNASGNLHAFLQAGTHDITSLRPHGTPVKINSNGSDRTISGGTINCLFQYLRTEGHDYMICPGWLAPLMDFSNFENDVRDPEMQDIERSDIIQALNLIFQGAETELALDHGTKKHVILALFEKIAEGTFRDFSQYTAPETALAASLLGYKSARDIVDGKSATSGAGSIGRVPYFGSLLDTKGKLIGKERTDFLDDLEEYKTASFMTASPEEFTKTLARTANFSDVRMDTRTRFGDHSVTQKYYPGCFTKSTVLEIITIDEETPYLALDPSVYGTLSGSGWQNLVADSSDTRPTFLSHQESSLVQQLILVPFYGWNMLDHACDTRGLLPIGMADDAMLDMRHMTVTRTSGKFSATGHANMWVDDDWKLSNQNLSFKRQRFTDDLYREWVERGSTIRNADAGELTSFSTVNFLGEITMNTPTAIMQRQLPILRSLFEQAQVGASDYQTAVSFGNNILAPVLFTSLNKFGGMDLCHDVRMNSDRGLFDPNSVHQVRNSGFDLMSPLYLGKKPEDLPGLYHGLVMLAAETDSFNGFPAIARAKYMNDTTGTSGILHNQELVIFQSVKDFQGKVTDVGCEAIVGGVDSYDSSLPWSSSSNVCLYVVSATPSSVQQRSHFSIWNWLPSASEALATSAAAASLGGHWIRSGGNSANGVEVPGARGKYVRYRSIRSHLGGSDQSVKAILGEHWKLRAYRSEQASFPGAAFDLCSLFGHSSDFLSLGSATPVTRVDLANFTADSGLVTNGAVSFGERAAFDYDGGDIDGVFSVGDDLYVSSVKVGTITDITRTDATQGTITIGDGVLADIPDNTTLELSPTLNFINGTIVSATSSQDQDIDTFVDKYGRFIENVRDDLEWQHSAPSILILDKDINDKHEFSLNVMLYGTGRGTRGPLTCWMVLDATGKTEESGSYVDDLAIEVIDLSLGTASEASLDTDVDDIGAESENPEMEIVTVPDA